MSGLGETVFAWPLLAPLAAAAAAIVHTARRRQAMNEALHELRRPLQAIALAAGDPHGSVGLAAAALDRLDREINGGLSVAERGTIAVEPLLAAAVRRWQGRAALRGASLRLSWGAGRAVAFGHGPSLSQAVDNLIVNAIEHGGPEIEVAAGRDGGELVLTVSDSGRSPASGARGESPHAAIARLTGRRRRGHGLGVVERVAREHGGRFSLRRGQRGAVATLALPLETGESRR